MLDCWPMPCLSQPPFPSPYPTTTQTRYHHHLFTVDIALPLRLRVARPAHAAAAAYDYLLPHTPPLYGSPFYSLNGFGTLPSLRYRALPHVDTLLPILVPALPIYCLPDLTLVPFPISTSSPCCCPHALDARATPPYLPTRCLLYRLHPSQHLYTFLHGPGCSGVW